MSNEERERIIDAFRGLVSQALTIAPRLSLKEGGREQADAAYGSEIAALFRRFEAYAAELRECKAKAVEEPKKPTAAVQAASPTPAAAQPATVPFPRNNQPQPAQGGRK